MGASFVIITKFSSCLCLTALTSFHLQNEQLSVTVTVELKKNLNIFHITSEGLERDRCCQGVMNGALLKSHEGNKRQASDPLKAAC